MKLVKALLLSNTFNRFFESEKSSGIVLVLCTVVSILIANSTLGADYLSIWHATFLGLSIEHWVNDGLMAIFFLMIGLELEREIYIGELSSIKNALLPICAAIGGMAMPALLHLTMNYGTPTQEGLGIPMATDIAFALGILAMLGSRIPASLKVFVVAFAVMDDLGAIVIIATFYTAKISISYLLGAFLVWVLLIVLNRVFRVMAVLPYIIGGLLMWFLMLKSGVHATVAGILLAFAIPFSAKDDDQTSPSYRLENWLHRPVAFIILPIFALANTGIIFEPNWLQGLLSINSAGIALGLFVGKPVGVLTFCYLAVILGICNLPSDLKWQHIAGAGMLGGIGFTMSIFITNLAFANDLAMINASKIAVLLASMSAGIIGYLWLHFVSAKDGK
ncbi:MAG: Na+/H+ antiporter NhaA [Methylophilaceae bacterium]